MEKFETVDEYIDSFDEERKSLLNAFRQKIKSITPRSEESMSYGMPGYKLNNKPLVYFGAFKNHIGFFPTPNGMEAFSEELKPYAAGKGTAQFKLDQPIPWGLVEKITRFRMEEVLKNK